MGGPGGHYAKWNKSDRERQLLYGLTYMWNLKQNKTKQTTQLTDTENRLGIVGIAGGWGWEGEKGAGSKMGERNQKVQISS